MAQYLTAPAIARARQRVQRTMIRSKNLAVMCVNQKSFDLIGKKMVHPERFERPTPRFVVWCSIQLSYGCDTNASARKTAALGEKRRGT